MSHRAPGLDGLHELDQVNLIDELTHSATARTSGGDRLRRSRLNWGQKRCSPTIGRPRPLLHCHQD